MRLFKDLSIDSFESWLKTKSDVGPMSEVEQGNNSLDLNKLPKLYSLRYSDYIDL